MLGIAEIDNSTRRKYSSDSTTATKNFFKIFFIKKNEKTAFFTVVEHVWGGLTGVNVCEKSGRQVGNSIAY